MKLTLTRRLPAPPDAVWPFLTEPALMNRWSLAPVRLLSPGDGGSAAGVGALREVSPRLAGSVTRLLEVIQRAEPPRHLVYRVVAPALVQRHRGELVLAGREKETLLAWEVDAELALPLAGGVAQRLLSRQLEASLDRLERAVRFAPPQKNDGSRWFADQATPELWAAAESILDAQRTLATRLAAARDPKQWFARVYAHVTAAQLEWLELGDVSHPAWVLRLIPRFHHYYVLNLDRHRGAAPGLPEPQWRAAFEVMEGRRGTAPERMIFGGLRRGVRAHIEEDLPRALAEVYVDHYAGLCDYHRFRADFLCMARVFERASARLTEELPPHLLPLITRAIAPLLPHAVAAELERRQFYDVPKARLDAFERGGRIAALLTRPLERARSLGPFAAKRPSPSA